MKKITKIINGNTYDFINEYWETYNAWGHKTTLLKNGIDISVNKVRYYNRTWESYTYQSCMLGVVYGLIDDRTKQLKEEYKRKNMIDRMSKARQKEFELLVENDEHIKELNKLMEEL